MTMVPSASNPLVFTFPDTAQPVRTIMIDGEPWFVIADACKILELSNPTMAADRLEPDDLSSAEVIDSMGRRQTPRITNEPGLYDLIFQSRKLQARAFKRWITHEVIPSIRRTGSYSMEPTPTALPDLTTPAGVLALAEQFAATARQLVEADEKIREMEPKALAHDTFLSAQDGDLLVREAAKLLGWQEKHLRAFLIDQKLIYRRQATCGQTVYDFYAAHAEHFRAVGRPVEHTWGRCNHYTLYVTARGLVLIQKRITAERAEIRAAIEGGAR